MKEGKIYQIEEEPKEKNKYGRCDATLNDKTNLFCRRQCSAVVYVLVYVTHPDIKVEMKIVKDFLNKS